MTRILSTNPSAIRKRRYCDRVQRRVCVTRPVEIGELVMDWLIKNGHVRDEDAEDPEKLAIAVGELLQSIADETEGNGVTSARHWTCESLCRDDDRRDSNP